MGASKPAAPTAKHADAHEHAHSRPTLEPRIKHIPQATIRKKWKPLPQSSQDKIHSILLNLKAKRSGGGGSARIPPVGRPGAKHTTRTAAVSKTAIAEAEYEKIVEDVASRLLSRLPRMPFPPASSSTSSKGTANGTDDFDLSSTLSRISALQAQLTCNVQAARLLTRQISREKAALKLDKKDLKTLEDGLRGSKEVRRRKERGLHPLARRGEGEGIGREHAAIIGIDAAGPAEEMRPLSLSVAFPAATTASTESTLDLLGSADQADPEMNALLGQLHSHLLSMRNNTASLVPVVDAVEEAKAALEKFAARNLDEPVLRRLYAG
ncbi:hypothetical protein PV04_07325 [Phialophora macrospora]|uniref:Kinetochore protein fta7 n=1 Tax=Phialophora macrospora TaxID=1851006 RepID=A0A0D2FAN4_9EURO|nr:hypothetical protein PV04_07325 [Phialophora macrospora]